MHVQIFLCITDVLVGINPDRRNKSEKKNRTHHSPVNPKVLALMKSFADISRLSFNNS